jgi:membrane associated rhomboid family serine protease
MAWQVCPRVTCNLEPADCLMSARKLEARTGGRGRRGHPGLGLLVCLIVMAWLVELIDQNIAHNLDRYGVIPRSFVGLRGVIFMPWLHSGWDHLFDNTVALLGLGVIVILAEGRRFASTTLILALISGLGTWIIADMGHSGKGIHIGASGLVYAYFGYILARAIWGRRLVWAVVGIVVAVVYGGMIGGIFPEGDHISWEAHLVGLLGGVWLGQRHS